MKQKRFSETEIMQILKQAEGGISVPNLCREHGMSNASFYKWRSKYGGMDASMISEIKPPLKMGLYPITPKPLTWFSALSHKYPLQQYSTL